MDFNKIGILQIDDERVAVRLERIDRFPYEEDKILLRVVPGVFDTSNEIICRARANGKTNYLAKHYGIWVSSLPHIVDVIYNKPATIVKWSDGSKTVVKCQPGDEFSEETGLALCIAKKYFGNKGNFNEVFKEWVPKEIREEISVEKMRSELVKYCDRHDCDESCLLSDNERRCGRGVHFRSKTPNGEYEMSDDEIISAYNKVFN